MALEHFEYSAQVLLLWYFWLFLKLDTVASVTLSLKRKEQLTNENEMVLEQHEDE